MSNKDKNIQFHNVCKELGIVDKGVERRFHEYLNSPDYEGISDNFTYQELLEVGKEFLEYAGITKTKKVKRRK